jgi:hypothetical protein
MCALPTKADIPQHGQDVCNEPRGDTAPSPTERIVPTKTFSLNMTFTLFTMTDDTILELF